MKFLVSLLAVFLCASQIQGANHHISKLVNPSGKIPGENITLEAYIHAFPLDDYKIYSVEGLGSFYLDEAEDSVKNWLKQGIGWEGYIRNLLEQYIRPGTVAIDIGAFNGVHTISMAKAVGKKGRVIAFEPQAKIYRELVQNCLLNKLNNVEAWHCAIGNEQGQVALCHDPKMEAGTWIGVNGTELVELRTLDSFHLRNISLMKIDAEGFEDKVLDGAKETLSANKPVIIIEIQGGWDFDTAPDNIRQNIIHTKQKLEELNYTVTKVSPHDYLAIPATIP